MYIKGEGRRIPSETVEADVLCIGGVAGQMAAIRAAELEAKVVAAEKGQHVDEWFRCRV